MNVFPLLLSIALTGLCLFGAPVTNLALGQKVVASATDPKYKAEWAVDGDLRDDSRWISLRGEKDPPWIEVHLGREYTLGGVHLFSGYQNGDAVEDFHVEFRKGEKWVPIPSASVAGNKENAVALVFDDNVLVRTAALRFTFTRTKMNVARIRDISIFPQDPEGLPKLPGVAARVEPNIPLIYLNQSGFNLGAPKRFTAPDLADGTPFLLRKKTGSGAVFSGKILGQKGDFTAFNPEGGKKGDLYVIEAGGRTSVPFGIGPWWLERVTYQRAVDFMIDTRNGAGTHTNLRPLSYGWRDDHHFAFELETLIEQYFANPSAFDRMPRQMTEERVPEKMGALEPCRAGAPDIVRLIHWGADVIVTQKLDHELMKGQLASFVHAWPWLARWLPRQNFEAALAFLVGSWGMEKTTRSWPYDQSRGHDLFALKTRVGTTKGALPPGASVLPNLLMHETLTREKRPGAGAHFAAAVGQAAWMVSNLDWNDPLTTKGQRMSEHVTLTGLSQLLLRYPKEAPPGLREKIADWARVVRERSDNLWDFRKYSATDWTPMGEKPNMWNEVGNVTGFPACLIAAMEVLGDGAKDLEPLVYSHFDGMFGRNPLGRHFGYQAAEEIEGVEFGWTTRLKGGNGMLEGARFVLDGSPKNFHYPHHPELANKGYTEGWVNFNTAYNRSLAWLAWHETRWEAKKEGDQVRLRLRAPVGFDEGAVETATVQITHPDGSTRDLVLAESSTQSMWFEGTVPVREVKRATYGYGYMARSVEVP